MPRIPTVISEIDARTGRTSGGIPSPSASPDAFGAGVARALGGAGDALQGFGGSVKAVADKAWSSDVANRIAQSDFTARELALRNQTGADGAGYQERVLDEYDTYVDEQAALIDNNEARAEYTRRMMAQRPGISSRSASYEFGIAAEHATNQTNTSLVGLDNRMRLQPDQYETLLQQGIDVINATNAIPATAKSTAITGWTQKASRSYFEGRLDSADDAFDVDEILSDLRSDEWAGKLSSETLDSLLGVAQSARASIHTKADADARAAVEFLEGRATNVDMLLPDAEIAAAQALVTASGNPVTQARMARIARDQEILRGVRKLPPAQQRDLIEETQGNGGNVAGLPQILVTSINDASASYGISPTYLAAMLGREAGAQIAAGDYDAPNALGASSAMGVAQIVDGTMLGLARNPANIEVVKSVTGIDMAGMSEADLLALRGNPQVAVLLAASYAAENAGIIKSVTGRDASDGELYMAHFLGGGGVTRLLKGLAVDPTRSAAEVLPDAAGANPSEFYKPNGDAYTVQELYNRLGSRFGGNTTYVAYGDAQTRENIVRQTETAINENPMGHAQSVGLMMLSDVTTPEGMAARGREARSIADYYGLPIDTMKPFQPDEAAELAKQISEGSADEALAVMAQVASMGGAVAKAAMKQLGETTDTYGYAGALQLETGSTAAADIVRGQKRIDENPAVMNETGVTSFEMSSAFTQATGAALYDVTPEARQSIMNAAIAHYVETTVARGGAGVFDPEKFGASIDAVLGGKEGAPVVGEVNGAKTTLPPGVSGELVEQAFGVMAVQDWVAMSEQRVAPRYLDGTVADPRDLQDEAMLRPIGGGKYKVALDDGAYLTTGNATPDGRLEAFILVPTAERLESVVAAAQEKASAKDAEAKVRAEAEAATPPTGQVPAPPMVSKAPPVGTSGDALQSLIDNGAPTGADDTLTAEELRALTQKYLDATP